MEKGDVVKIEYVGRLESGEIFDLTSEELAKKEKIFNPKARYGSVSILIGANFVLPGLDKELETMKVGDEREVTVEPQEAFGKRKPELVKPFPSKSFREDPKPGTMVDFGDTTGRVQTVSGGRVMVDFNHPLAGKRLIYKISILEKVDGEEEKLAAVMEFFGINCDKVEVSEGNAKIYAPAPKSIKDKAAEVILKHMKINSIEFIDRYEKKSKGNETKEKE